MLKYRYICTDFYVHLPYFRKQKNIILLIFFIYFIHSIFLSFSTRNIKYFISKFLFLEFQISPTHFNILLHIMCLYLYLHSLYYHIHFYLYTFFTLILFIVFCSCASSRESTGNFVV